MGQGRDSLNLSACYSCSLIPETSCEEFNIFLDRGTIVGTYENHEMGFYSKQLYGTDPWKDTSVCEDTSNIHTYENRDIIVIDPGLDLRDSSYSDIWKDLRAWSDDETEKALLSDLEAMSDTFSQKEKPHRECIFRISGNSEQYTCDLYWEKSKLAFFTTDHEDSYLAARGSSTRCFYSADRVLTTQTILDALKER
jgi:hypothetical protein